MNNLKDELFGGPWALICIFFAFTAVIIALFQCGAIGLLVVACTAAVVYQLERIREKL